MQRIYNAERYLQNALDSVVSQSYEGFELILVDNGSKDGSLQICHTYEQKYPAVHVFEEKNPVLPAPEIQA